jgi:outer membrane receptor for ferrienterochelin and colicin
MLHTLSKIDKIIEWEVFEAGDIIFVKNREENETKLLKNGNVLVDGREISTQVWLKDLYGWSSVQTYVFAEQKENGQTLSQILEEHMNNQAQEIVEKDMNILSCKTQVLCNFIMRGGYS